MEACGKGLEPIQFAVGSGKVEHAALVSPPVVVLPADPSLTGLGPRPPPPAFYFDHPWANFAPREAAGVASMLWGDNSQAWDMLLYLAAQASKGVV